VALIELPVAAAVLADCVAWAVIGTATGYAWHRVPAARLGHDGPITRPRRFERGGRWYEQRWRIRAWKRHLPEAGGLFRDGYSKRTLRSGAGAALDRFRIETRRAELTHWCVVVWTPVFVLWNPLPLFGAMVAYALIANGPCIAAQRYNRARLDRVLARPRARPPARGSWADKFPTGSGPEAGSMDGSAPGRRSADD
jgi:glycosyl-4,4'-diaponeurosporenoate acyltransferase